MVPRISISQQPQIALAFVSATPPLRVGVRRKKRDESHGAYVLDRVSRVCYKLKDSCAAHQSFAGGSSAQPCESDCVTPEYTLVAGTTSSLTSSRSVNPVRL